MALDTYNSRAKSLRTTRLHVSGLKVGMFVSELDRPWLETPFLLQGFEIQNLADIEEIQKYCEYVVVEERYIPKPTPTMHTHKRDKGQKRLLRSSNHVPDLTKASKTHKRAQTVTRTVMDDIRLGKVIDVKKTEATVASCVEDIISDPTAMLWMARMRDHNERITEHAMNVMILAISLARHLKFELDDLQKIGLCALLHDVGMIRMPPHLLLNSTLSEDDTKEYRKHPHYGYQILLSNKDLYVGAATVAYTHHEAIDGSGYPRGLTGNKLLPYTKLISICDTYDDLTVDGLNGHLYSSLDAMRYLRKNSGTKYDKDYVTAFIQCMGLYPSGSVVELASGEVGLVVSQNEKSRRLPNVLIVRDKHKQPCRESLVNLARLEAKGEAEGYMLRNVLPNGTHGVRLEHYIQKGLQIS